MKQIYFMSLAGLIGLGVAHSAKAAIMVTETPEGHPIDVYGDSAPGYSAYVLTVTADPGDDISAFDVGGTAGSSNGIDGSLLQEWDVAARGGAVTPTSYESMANSITPSGEYSTDSHFLISPSTITPLPNEGETENNDESDPSGAPSDAAAGGTENWGTGSSLTGTFALSTASYASSVALAYVVIPNGSNATYSIGVSEVNASTLLPVLPEQTLSGAIPVPEPASITVLSIGSFGLLARRRQRNG